MCSSEFYWNVQKKKKIQTSRQLFHWLTYPGLKYRATVYSGNHWRDATRSKKNIYYLMPCIDLVVYKSFDFYVLASTCLFFFLFIALISYSYLYIHLPVYSPIRFSLSWSVDHSNNRLVSTLGAKKKIWAWCSRETTRSKQKMKFCPFDTVTSL